MTRVVVALYDQFSDVENAIKELLENGYSRQDISLLANDAGGRFGQYSAGVTPGAEGGLLRTGAGKGALTGGMGGVLVGYRALELPGIGPVVVAGPLAELFSDANSYSPEAGGAPKPDVLSALMDLGIPEEQAHAHAEGVRRGATLVAQYAADHMAEAVREIMNRHNPANLKRQVQLWQEQAWTGFNPEAAPLTPEELHVEGQSAQLQNYEEDFLVHEGEFRRHYHENFANSPYGYDAYLPAYHLGYQIAREGRAEAGDWEALEPEIRERWEREGPGKWEDFEAAVRHAWETVR